jgi:hypothetical protein
LLLEAVLEFGHLSAEVWMELCPGALQFSGFAFIYLIISHGFYFFLYGEQFL